MRHSEGDVAHPLEPAPGVGEYDLVDVAAAMQLLSEQVDGDDRELAPLDALVQVSLRRVPRARWVSVSMLRDGRFTTVASTAEQAVRADVLQYTLGFGPCVDAVLSESISVTGEVGEDPRWSEWGRRAQAEIGVRSVLAQRLRLHDQAGVVAGLNIYSDAPEAFDRKTIGVALILATHGAMVLSEKLASRQAGNLSKGLQSNREIGVAMGILMTQNQFTRTQAFDVLRVASQNTNRRLADIAVEVVDTGSLTIDHRP